MIKIFIIIKNEMSDSESVDPQIDFCSNCGTELKSEDEDDSDNSLGSFVDSEEDEVSTDNVISRKRVPVRRKCDAVDPDTDPDDSDYVYNSEDEDDDDDDDDEGDEDEEEDEEEDSEEDSEEEEGC